MTKNTNRTYRQHVSSRMNLRKTFATQTPEQQARAATLPRIGVTQYATSTSRLLSNRQVAGDVLAAA